MVFLKKSQLSILKIPHFHVSSVDFVDCLFVYNMWGKGNLRLRDFYRAVANSKSGGKSAVTKLG